MGDHGESEVSLADISGEVLQRAAAAKLCFDCRALFERISELESGAPKHPRQLWRHPEELMWRMKRNESNTPIEEEGRFENWKVFLDLPEDNSMPHKSDRAELEASSVQGCISCKWLLESLISRSGIGTIIEKWLKRPATVELDRWRSHLAQRCPPHYKVTLRSPAPPPPLIAPGRPRRPAFIENGRAVQWPSAPKPWPYQQLRSNEIATLLIDVMPSSDASQKLSHTLKNLERETPSSATWKLFHTWLDECTRSHTDCRAKEEERLGRNAPASLIDIQQKDLVRLVETEMLVGHGNGSSLKYATLSHCWGSTHDPRLNKYTSKTLQQGLPLDKLPRTYRDSVILARHLQIPYLWIDSLCIFQDSGEDWRRESSKMGEIYEQSYLCIAASAATDNNSGLLEKRTVHWPRPLVYGNLIICADIKKETSLNMRQPGWCNRMRTLAELAVDLSSLNKRAWVLQERLFAPRILHCTLDEFVWECRTGMRSESHFPLTSGGSLVKDVWKELQLAPASLNQQLGDPSVLREKRKPYLERWSQLVERFTSCDISVPQDRLPAVSAIAKRLIPLLGSYSGGLWEEYMPTQLLWCHSDIFNCQRRHKLRRNSSPTWSWSSLDCGVMPPCYFDEDEMENFDSAQSRELAPRINRATFLHIKILNVNVELVGEDVAGSVKGGRIELAGPLFPIYKSAAFGFLLSTEPLPESNYSRGTGIHWCLDNLDNPSFQDDKLPRQQALERLPLTQGDKLGIRTRDIYRRQHQALLAIHSAALTRMCCLPIASTGIDESQTKVYGLILEHVEESVGVYRRIGCFQCWENVFKGYTKSELGKAVPLDNQWPSRTAYNSEDGFTIALI